MRVVKVDVDVIEEVLTHEVVIALRMFFIKSDVFVHIKGNDVFKGKFAGLIQFYQLAIGAERRGTGWQPQDERAFGCRTKTVDFVSDVVGCPNGAFVIVGSDYNAHNFFPSLKNSPLTIV